MRVDKASKVKPRRKTVRRVLAMVIGTVVVLIVSVVLLVPAFISSEKGRRIILARINDSIAGKADFSDLSMGWLKGVKVADLSFDDDVGRVSVRVGQVSTKPSYGALLTGNLAFGETVIDKPSVEINLEDLRAAEAEIPAGKPPAPEAAQPIALPVRSIDLVLNDGNVKITDPESGTTELSRINSKVSLQPPGRQTDFDLKMDVLRANKASAIKVAGHVTPKRKTGWSLKGTSGNLTVEVNDLDLESLGPIFALAGIDIRSKGVAGGAIDSKPPAWT
ncbi:MAG: AsmA family protein [Planctomycetota bacterium]|jgi:autotransporter translocation and assembly factor TamB